MWIVMKYFSYTVITLLLCIIIRIALYELSYYMAVKRYANIPGVGTYYEFMKGILKVYLENDGNDSFKAISELTKLYSDKKMFVANIPGLTFGNVCVYLVRTMQLRTGYIKMLAIVGNIFL